jgi:hypothetical protein
MLVAAADVNGRTIDFGDVTIGTTAAQTFNFTNWR